MENRLGQVAYVPPKNQPPLVVDLDHSLLCTDALWESFIQTLVKSFWYIFLVPIWLWHGRAYLKAELARRAQLTPALLPYNAQVLAYLMAERSAGRKLILATASNEIIANAVADHLKIFDGVLASTASVNLKGIAKKNAIEERVGDEYIYLGDSSADIPIWASAKGAILVTTKGSLVKAVTKISSIIKIINPEPMCLRDWLRAIKLHQWSKNLLLFVPLFTSFSFVNLSSLGAECLGFIAFSLTASATYLLNDLHDLSNDRLHPNKKFRPLASGKLSIPLALCAAGVLLMAGLFFAASVSTSFCIILLIYLVGSLTYSWLFKEMVILDALCLSGLYTLRVLAGALAIGVETSDWLLAFSVFIFLSLALIKRCSELVLIGRDGELGTRGRDYRVADLAILWPFGISAAMSAVVIFGIYISVPSTAENYANPDLLWLTAMGLVYWLARLWIKTSRGEMHDDPVVFAITDFGSQMSILAMILIVLVAHFIPFSIGP